MADVTQILSNIEQGDSSASDQLLPLIYTELRKLAAAKIAQEKPGQTLQATAIVHEAYVRLVNVDQVQKWESRGHFFAAAAETICRILVEQARRKAGPKAGGNHHRVELSDVALEGEAAKFDLLSLNEALGVSVATADNDWAYAKGWLQVQMSDESASDG